MLQKSLFSINMNMVFSIFIPFFLFLLLLYKWLLTNSSRTKNLPPSPPKLPILGHLHKLGKHPHRSLQALSKRYGELMLIYLGTKPALIVSSATMAKEIMKTHDAVLSNRPMSTINDRLLYKSRVVGASRYGDYWRQMKSVFVLHLLSSRRVKTYRAVREEETALLLEKIADSDGSIVNMSEQFSTITNDVVCRVAFGKKYIGDFREILGEVMELLGVFNVGDFIPWLKWVDKIKGLDARLDDVAKKFDMILEKILTEHLDQQIIERQSVDDEIVTKNFVDVLLDIQRENSVGFAIERDGIKALILDVFAAGTHTTSTLLEWTMAELLRNPRVMNELQKQVREITKSKQFVTEDDLEHMKYLTAVIKETLRLHPPIPMLVPRESIQALNINGYDIAANTMVYINAWAIQRDPVTWDEPEEFRPERFLDSLVDFRGQDFELIPFGSGRRACPGIQFAIANNGLVLANLVNKFDWALPGGITGETTVDMSEGTGLTICKKSPLLVVATHLK